MRTLTNLIFPPQWDGDTTRRDEASVAWDRKPTLLDELTTLRQVPLTTILTLSRLFNSSTNGSDQ
jgi:hypothetical protein